MGSVAAPLLAGFAIAMLGLVLQIEDDVRWPDAALLLLAGAAVLLLASVQFAFRSRLYGVTPTQVTEWHEDFESDVERRQRVRAELQAGRTAYRSWSSRARRAYNAGIIMLLAGLAVTLVPSDSVSAVRMLAAGTAALGAIFELVLIAADRLVDSVAAPMWLRRIAWSSTSADPLRHPDQR